MPVAAFLALTAAVGAQVVPDSTPTSPRVELPFATEPDRLPGPPRAMGELPEGASQPPSTLPGRVFGQPPRAMGESPQLPSTGPFLFTPGPRGGPTDLPGMAGGLPGTSPAGPFGSFFAPGAFRMGSGPANPSPSDLPPALPDAGTAPPPGPGIGAAAGPPLELEEVLASTERTHPGLLAAFQERGIASGDLLSTQGAFDLHLNADSRNYPLGYYNRSVHDVTLEQPTAWNGAKFFGGYRVASGRFPDYYNYLNTRGGGAFIGGMDLPLLRNRAIDARRAKVMQAEIELRKAEPTVFKQRIELFRNASKAHAGWAAAGRSLAIYRDLVRVAEARNAGLERQLREGLLRPIDLVDFRRILVSRQQQAITAERRFQQATIELSFYSRDARGFPSLADPSRLPPSFPLAAPPDPGRLGEDLEVALRLRPEMLSLRLQIQKAQVDRQFAQNQLLPSLNLYVYAEQNVGNRDADLGKDFRPFILESSLLFDVPLQRRYAKGRVRASEATLAQLAAQAQLACDRVRADVLDATSALRAAHEQVIRARENEALARRLERAEQALQREGSSTVLFVNLREQATSDALVQRVEAEARLMSALADYRAALGVDAVPPDRGRSATD
jgi:outer membrane protein TolC